MSSSRDLASAGDGEFLLRQTELAAECAANAASAAAAAADRANDVRLALIRARANTPGLGADGGRHRQLGVNRDSDRVEYRQMG